jgi:hypothetical protein
MLALKGKQALKAQPVYKDQLDCKVRWDRKVQQVQLDRKVQQVQLGHKA